jgi:cobalamin synthase
MLGTPKKQRFRRILRDYRNGPAGVLVMISWYKAGASVFMGAVMSVSIHPGAIAFTWILNGANSIAIDLVSCTKAPFAAL